ncbi:MAG: Outer membrane transport energization protein ExbB, partial [Candidatus Kuenenbacteria bacterium GW2011_GWA2_42_15]
ASAYTSANTPASCSGATVSSSQINWSWVSGGAQNSFYASNTAGNSNWIPGLAWSQSSGFACNTSYTTSVKARNNESDETISVQCSASTSACAGSPVDAAYQWCAANSNTVIFIDQSSGGVGGVTGWTWDFGDGKICPATTCNAIGYNGTNQHPVHQYTGGVPPADWWSAGAAWQYRRKITFDNTGRAALDNFPVLVKQTAVDIDFWAHVKSNGSDLRFIDNNGSSELYFELEKWDYGNQEMIAWVKVQQIAGNSNSDYIYLYYGNAAASVSSKLSPANVWTNNYRLVWHLNDNSGHFQDSTSLNLDSTAETGIAYQAAGQLGYGVAITAGQNNYITRMDSGLLRNDPYTWELWYKPTNISATAKQIWGESVRYSIKNNGFTYFSTNTSPQSLNYTGASHVNNTWYYTAFIKTDSGNNRAKIYRNGILYGEQGGSDKPSEVSAWTWWRVGGGFGGTVDEVRVSAGARSADWIAFQYCNIMQTCTSYSAPQTDYTVILTARDAASNTDQSIQTVHLDPVAYGCAGLGCEPACYTPLPCSTSQCDNNANGFRYLQTRASICPDNCHCPAWSAYQSCQSSFNNCLDASPYRRVECYTGAGCDTAVNVCTCAVGYAPNGAGGCDLREFTFYETKPLGSTQLSLKWQKQGAASSYSITRNSVTLDVACTTDPCFYTDTGLTAGTTYTYYIFAHVGGSGIYNSTVNPNPACGGSPSNICPLAGTTDSVVSGLTITPTCGQLELKWNNLNVGGVTGYVYNIRKSTTDYTTAGVPWLVITPTECANNMTPCTYQDKEVLPQVDYYYTIVSEKDGVESLDHAEAKAKSYCYQAPGWEER